MQVGFATRAIKGTDDKIMFTGSLPFFNTVDQGGVAKMIHYGSTPRRH